MLVLASFVSGLIFGGGLLISGMINPEKVLSFLDIFGRWDPSLGIVMAAALVVSSGGFMVASRRPASLAAKSQFSMNRMIDTRLIIGSMLFGVGWGLVGLCPGPAVENLATLSPPVIIFVLAMAGGMVLHDFFQSRQRTAARGAILASADG